MPRPSDEDYQKLQWLLKRLGITEEFCRPYFERAKRHYRLYRFGSAIDEADWPYVNRTRTRDIFAFCEDSTAIMVQTLFGSVPFFSVIPRYTSQMMLQYTGINPINIAKQLETFIDNQISTEQAEFFEEITDFFKEGTIYGNSYLGVYPRFDEGNQYLGPIFKTIGFWDVLPICGAKRITKARGVFVREFISKEEAQELAQKFGYQGSVENMKGWNEGVDKKWHTDLLAEVGIQTWNPESDEIELLHYFSGGHIITLADRAIILRDSRMPQKNQLGEDQVVKPFPFDQPIVQYKFIPLPQEWFGMGIPETLEVLQEDRNLIRSARRDNIDLVINKIIKARIGADINYDLIKYYPGAIWPLENLNDIDVLDQGDVTQSSYMEEQKIQADMENALSLFGYARGMTPTHEEKPTTVIRLQQASLNRLDLAVKMAEYTTLQNIAIRVVLLARRYMSQQTYETIIGDQDAGLYKLSEEAIQRFYTIKPMGSSVTKVKEARQQQIGLAMQILEKVAPVAMSGAEPFSVNWYQATKSGLDALDIKNLEQLIVKMSPEQVQMTVSRQEQEQLKQVKYGEDMKVQSQIQIDNNKAKNDILLETVKAKVEHAKSKEST